MKKLEGIMTPIPTPLDKNSNLLKDSVVALVNAQLDMGIDGIYVCGGTGEGVVLSKEIRKEMAECVVNVVKGKIPVIVHTGAVSLADAIELSQHAESIGADYISSVPPFGVVYDGEGVYNYYKALASSVNIPLIVYYSSNAIRISNETFLKIFDLDNVIGIKWTNRDYFDMMYLKDNVSKEFYFINGPDETLLCGLAAGCSAGIGTTYNVMIPKFKSLYSAFKSGDIEKARDYQHEINGIINVICKYGAIQSIKEILTSQGFDMGPAIAPMKEITAQEKLNMMEELKKAGL